MFVAFEATELRYSREWDDEGADLMISAGLYVDCPVAYVHFPFEFLESFLRRLALHLLTLADSRGSRPTVAEA